MNNKQLTIIAGPCSVNEKSMQEILQISDIEINGKKVIAGTRVVGLKSRTSLDPSGDGMGIDYDAVINNIDIIQSGGSIEDFTQLPSSILAEEIHNKTGLIIASEIMIPSVQLPSYDNKFQNGKFLPWNPSVNQLGWQLFEIAKYSQKNNWHVGIKNAKWIGEKLELVEDDSYTDTSPLEKIWGGLVNYASNAGTGNIILIQRGVDIPNKGKYRNAPVHRLAGRTKTISNNIKLYFDPSHTLGPRLKDNIVDATIEAMKMKIDKNTYLYEGVLIEVGTSITDTDQHISLDELEQLVTKLSTFRELISPDIKSTK